MTDQLTVIMGESVAGALNRLDGGRLRFDYAEAYAAETGATPISVSMPLELIRHGHDRVAPWIAGLLPDDPDVVARWSRRFQVGRSPFAILGTPVGEDCAGAVRFCRPERLGAVIDRPGRVDWLDEAGVADRIRELRRDTTAWLGRTFAGQFSLAGAQAKTALLFRDGRWGAPSGSIPTTHILKPAVGGFDDHDLNEHLCLTAARLVGLRVARSRIEMFDGESALVLERYDRTSQAGTLQRVHQEDLCQALSVPPDRKYQNQGGPSPGRIARLLREVMPAQVAEQAVRGFADALIWNWLIGGTDAHAKNYPLLLSGRQVRLAPLYDIASILPYGFDERELRMAMKVGGRYALRPGRNPWPRAADELGLDAALVVDRVRELAALLPDAFATAADDQDILRLRRDLPQRLVALVADRAARCARVVA